MFLNQVRDQFLKYFLKNDHLIKPSSSLIPSNDPTLLFTAAGMVQFKDFFTGQVNSDFKRVTTSQKCLRAGGKHNDLDNVGYTARHHTFFEMLGNFSFGDYFKEEAIELAWNLLTKIFEIDSKKLYITIYDDDDESFNIWRKITGFKSDKIIKIATSDNFWSMGDLGPCGPCSEIFYDHGDKYFGDLPGTKDADGDRFVEIWNLVFMQFEDTPNGRISLPKPSIDTGMGLERISAVLQGKNNNFDIDIFQKLIQKSKDLTKNPNNLQSHNVIADHIRAIGFMISDGILPQNEGRGYVLRRIMRRAMRHWHILDNDNIKLDKMIPTLIDVMGDAYSELSRAESLIISTVEAEQNRFENTLQKGLKILKSEISKLSKDQMFSGETAFKLYDTYGFPIDLTSDILKDYKLTVNINEFENQMALQKQRGRLNWSGSGDKSINDLWYKLIDLIPATQFIGYEANNCNAQILAIIKNDECVEQIDKGDAIIILDKTVFYAESGGQVGDIGMLDDSKIINTIKFINKYFGHYINVVTSLKVGQYVNLQIDYERRLKIQANHSATHLLHYALRKKLGDHVSQKGSLVNADKLRFDFSHTKLITLAEINDIERSVNEMIIKNYKANIKLMPLDEATNNGAMALFGEKYDDVVRVVSIDDSIELCGGIHVDSTGDIGLFKIISCITIAAGIKRIEAITGMYALEHFISKEAILNNLVAKLKCTDDSIVDKVEDLVLAKKDLEKKFSDLKILQYMNNPKEEYPINGGVLYIIKLLDVVPSDMKLVLNRFSQKHSYKSVVLVSSINENKVSICISVSEDLTGTYKANQLAKLLAADLNGSGGGSAKIAQIGSNDSSLYDQAIESLIKNFQNLANEK